MIDEISEALAAWQPCKTHPHTLRREGRAQPGDVSHTRESIKKTRKAGQQQAGVQAEGEQCLRQCRSDITKPT